MFIKQKSSDRLYDTAQTKIKCGREPRERKTERQEVKRPTNYPLTSQQNQGQKSRKS